MKNIVQKDGKYYIEADVVMLPTEKPSNLYISKETNELRFVNSNKTYTGDKLIAQALYFISNEEIKEGDWVILLDSFGKAFLNPQQWMKKGTLTKDHKKIIATTDESLIFHDKTPIGENKNGLWKQISRPSNEFLQAYARANGDIKKVLVEVEIDNRPKVTGNERGFVVDNPNFNTYQLKVAEDNTITIKKIEEKAYSRQDMLDFAKKFAFKSLGEKGVSKFDRPKYYPDQQWIDENL